MSKQLTSFHNDLSVRHGCIYDIILWLKYTLKGKKKQTELQYVYRTNAYHAKLKSSSKEHFNFASIFPKNA